VSSIEWDQQMLGVNTKSTTAKRGRNKIYLNTSQMGVQKEFSMGEKQRERNLLSTSKASLNHFPCKEN